MISIIICSRRTTIPDYLSINIKKTIGCEFELIVIDNSENKYSIFEAYNMGIEKSKGEYLCFFHDDILIHTNDWGQIVQAIFNNKKEIGLIGVAGSKTKSKMPSAWWNCPQKNIVVNIIQHTFDNKIEKQTVGFNHDNTFEEVVVIDGVFMVMRKIDSIIFSKKMNGYHNYDLNISFEYNINGFKIVVINEVLIEHFSQGNIDDSWYASTFKIHSLYNKYLPLKAEAITTKNNELDIGIHFIEKAIKIGEKKIAFKVWLQLFYLNPFTKFHFQIFRILLKKC